MDRLEQLNKKLAKWAGFEFVNYRYWLYPDGTYHKELPNFPQSLDACFEWLMQKPKSKVFLVLWAMDVVCDWAEGKEPRPALALCLAIEKLINGGQ